MIIDIHTWHYIAIGDAPREIKKTCHIWHKNSIRHLLRTSRDYFRPHPKVSENK